MAEYDPSKQSLSPSMQVYLHVLQKGFQAGSSAGAAVVIPATAAYARLYKKAAPVSGIRLIRTAGVSCLTGLGLTGEPWADCDADSLEETCECAPTLLTLTNPHVTAAAVWICPSAQQLCEGGVPNWHYQHSQTCTPQLLCGSHHPCCCRLLLMLQQS